MIKTLRSSGGSPAQEVPAEISGEEIAGALITMLPVLIAAWESVRTADEHIERYEIARRGLSGLGLSTILVDRLAAFFSGLAASSGSPVEERDDQLRQLRDHAGGGSALAKFILVHMERDSRDVTPLEDLRRRFNSRMPKERPLSIRKVSRELRRICGQASVRTAHVHWLNRTAQCFVGFALKK